MTDDDKCPVCNGNGGWQQYDGLIVECPAGCMEPEWLNDDEN